MAKKVLIIEDEAALRIALEFELKKAGFEILVATDGEDGLKKALAEKPDLTLLDIVMPKMDGMKVLDQLSKSEIGRKSEVIILTNLSPCGEMILNNKGMKYEYLVKADWKIEDLMEKIKNMLNKNKHK